MAQCLGAEGAFNGLLLTGSPSEPAWGTCSQTSSRHPRRTESELTAGGLLGGQRKCSSPSQVRGGQHPKSKVTLPKIPSDEQSTASKN